MPCSSVMAGLMDYIDGDLAGSQASDMEQHLDGCPSCSARLRTYQVVPQLLREAFENDRVDNESIERLVCSLSSLG